MVSPELTALEVERLSRRGLRLAQFTVAYHVVGGAVAITAGILAGLVSVIGFGVDSGHRVQHCRARGPSLLTSEVPEASPLRIGLLVASIIVMPIPAAAKRRVGNRLGDKLILADAAETRICWRVASSGSAVLATR